MNRRQYLVAAVGGTALATGSFGSVAAQGLWGDGNGSGDDSASDGTGGTGDDGAGASGATVVSATIEELAYGGDSAPVVECDGTTVDIEGAVITSNSCQKLYLERTAFDGETLTVTVSTRWEQADDCPGGIGPQPYVATVTTSTAPDTVVVEHGTSEEARHTCGTPPSEDHRVISRDYREPEPVTEGSEPGVEIECDGSEVAIDGIVEAQDNCNPQLYWRYAEYDGETLTVAIGSDPVSEGEPCLPKDELLSYAYTVTASSAPDTVVVEHQSAAPSSVTSDCGTGSGGDAGSGAASGSSDGGTDTGDSGIGSGVWGSDDGSGIWGSDGGSGIWGGGDGDGGSTTGEGGESSGQTGWW